MRPAVSESSVLRQSFLVRAADIGVLTGVAVLLGFQCGFALKAFMGEVYAVNAQAAEKEHKTDTARWSLARSLDWNPADYRILYRYGVLQKRTGNLEEAAQAFSTGLQWAPHHVLTMLALADLNARVGRFAEADRLIAEAETRLPGYWRTHRVAGIRFGHEGEHARAAQEFKAALASGGERAKPVLALLATAYFAQEELDAALTYARQAVAYDDTRSANHLLLGKIWLAKESAFESRASFLHALDAFAVSGGASSAHAESLAETYAYLGRAYMMEDELGNAIESLALAVDIDPESIHAMRVADVLADHLEKFSREDMQADSDFGSILVNAGALFVFLDQIDRAESFLLDAYFGSLSDADRIGCELILAKIHLDRDRPLEALNLIERAKDRATAPSLQIERALADALARNGRTAQARLQYLDTLQRFSMTSALREEIEQALRGLD